MDLRKEFEKETKDQLYYWFQEYSGASMEEHGFSEEYVEWLEAKVKKLRKVPTSTQLLSDCKKRFKELEEKGNLDYRSYRNGYLDSFSKNVVSKITK